MNTYVRPTVLIIDSDRATLKILAEKLEAAGMRPLKADTAQEASFKVRAFFPDLIISDSRLKDLDGCELVSQLRRQVETSHTPIIMRSTMAEESDVIYGLAVGADDYMAKSRGMGELLARARGLLRQSRRAQAIEGGIYGASTGSA